VRDVMCDLFALILFVCLFALIYRRRDKFGIGCIDGIGSKDVGL